jgi:hypothetical protein
MPAWPGGYLREQTRELQPLTCTDATIAFDDERRTVLEASVTFATPTGDALKVQMTRLSPSIVVDIGHTCQVPERWLYWRTLVHANVEGWDAPVRGWFETSRYAG